MSTTMASTVRIDPVILENSSGFSYDIGGTAAKVAYRSKEHHSGGRPKSKDYAGLVTVEFISDVTTEKIVDFVKEKCDLTPGGQCFSTGSGANKFQQTLEETIGVRVSNLGEGDCFITAISALASSAKIASDVFLPKPPEAIAEADKQIEIFMSYQAALKDQTSTSLDIHKREEPKASVAPEIKYPFLMVTCGSAISFIRVEKDGSNKFLGMTNLGGRAFMGLTKALTGAKDFNEMNALMEGANGRTVDEWMSDIINPSSKSDVYSSVPGDVIVYRLGKLNRFSADEVKKEDIAQSLTALFAVNAATLSILNSKVAGVKNVYLCGNLVSNCPVFRHNFTANFLMESALNVADEPISFEFLANGGFLGALGALMNDTKMSTHL